MIVNEQKTGFLLQSNIHTPLGQMTACATDDGICLLEFHERAKLDISIEKLRLQLGLELLNGENRHIQQLKTELDEYFVGKRKVFEVKLQLHGTDFQKKVWQALLKIPYGTTSTYLQQAQVLKNVPAIRAVGTANGQNKIAIVVPCHRVIGKNGDLTGYAGGVERKRWLLIHEKSHSIPEGHLF